MSLIKKIKAKIALKRLAHYYDKKSKEFCEQYKLVRAAKQAADYLKDKGLAPAEVESINTIYNDLFEPYETCLKRMEENEMV